MKTLKLIACIVLSFLMMLISEKSFSQSREIRGHVYDLTSGQRIQFANILVKELDKNGTTTNANGEFVLAVPNNSIYTLMVTTIGFKTQSYALMPKDTLVRIFLEPFSYSIQEIQVYSQKERHEGITSITSIKSEKIAEFSGFTKDIVRTAQLMPGVSGNSEANARFNVRGGTYDENLVLVNGVRVYEPFHLKEISHVGIGIFNMDLADKVVFSSGGFSAEYGDAISSLLKINYRNGNKEKFSAKLHVSLLDLNAIVEGPITKKSSIIIGLKKSYLDYAAKMVDLPSSYEFSYYDIQGKYNYNLSPNHNIQLNFIYSHDNYRVDPLNENYQIKDHMVFQNQYLITDYNQIKTKEGDAVNASQLISLTSTHRILKKLKLNTQISYYHENVSSNNNFSLYGIEIPVERQELFVETHKETSSNQKFKISNYDIESSVEYQLTMFSSIKAGVNYNRINYTLDYWQKDDQYFMYNIVNYPDTTIDVWPDDPRKNFHDTSSIDSYKVGWFIQDGWQITPNLFLSSGVRMDYYKLNQNINFDPRISLSYRTPFNLKINGAWGIYHQIPRYNQIYFTDSLKNNVADNQEAIHYIFGFDYQPLKYIQICIEGFYKDYKNLIPVTRDGRDGLHYYKGSVNAVGYARGFDLQIVANYKKHSLWLSYGLLEAKEKILDEEDEYFSNLDYFSRYSDQRHTWSAIYSAKFSKKWKLSLRYFYGSGYAFTPYYTELDEENNLLTWQMGDMHAEHYPAYSRVDLSVSKEFKLFDNPLMVNFDILNLLNKRNILSYDYTYNSERKPVIENKYLYGLIPSLGISYSF